MSIQETEATANEGAREALTFSQRAGELARLRWWRARLEYLILAGILLFAVTVAVSFFVFDIGTDRVRQWGYIGLFFISLLRASSVLIPIPGSGLTFAAGAFMAPVFGIPAPIAVGVTAGVAESFGEFTGYAAGHSGSKMLDGRRIYHRIKGWIQKRAFVTMLVMAFMPSPVFDVAGIAAGAARVPIRTFYTAILIGKVGRGIAMASAGYYGVELISKIF